MKKKITVKINGMKCKGCSGSVESTLKSIQGVLSCRASHEKGNAVVKYDDSVIKKADIIKNVTELGFEASSEQ